MIRSATPQLSKKVLSLTDGNNNFENAFISLRPSLMIAAYTYLENQKIRQNITLFFLAEKLQILKKSFKTYFCITSHLQAINKTCPICVSFFDHSHINKREREKTKWRYCATNLLLWPQHFLEFHTIQLLQHPEPIYSKKILSTSDMIVFYKFKSTHDDMTLSWQHFFGIAYYFNQIP